METLLNRISSTGLDPTNVKNEEAIIFWTHVRTHIATNSYEEALCWIISSEIRRKLGQPQNSIDELVTALQLLTLPQDLELMLSIRISLSERYFENSNYPEALNEYITISSIAVENSRIDEYAMAILGMGKLCAIFGDIIQAIRYYRKIDSVDHAIASRTLRLQYKIEKLTCYIELKNITKANELIAECEELSILVSDKSLTGKIVLLKTKLYLELENVDKALKLIASVPYASAGSDLSSFSYLVKIQLAVCFVKLGKPFIAEMLLLNRDKKVASYTHPSVLKDLYNSLSQVYEFQHQYKEALEYQKKSFQIESDLMQHIPIGELGPSQLRRLSRYELQLKLILSEIENKELKETTETQKHTVAKLQQDAFIDPLTKLHNRRWLETKLKELLIHSTKFSFLIVDIDHFKSINDELSHLVGDKAIVNVSSELANYFKFKGSHGIRFGGEEFLVILEGANMAQATMYAEQFRERIYRFNWAPVLGNDRSLTISIGVTEHRKGENTQRTFYRADKALYRAKANGRNQVCSE